MADDRVKPLNLRGLPESVPFWNVGHGLSETPATVGGRYTWLPAMNCGFFPQP